jgi:hypothetical protein
MDRQRVVLGLEDAAHDLDLVVFELEQAVRAANDEGTRVERDALRRRLERLRDRMRDLAERAAEA